MKYYILPEPAKKTEKQGKFYVKYDTEIVLNEKSGNREYGYAKLLAETIQEYTGFCLSVRKGEINGKNGIFLNLLADEETENTAWTASNKKDEINKKKKEEAKSQRIKSENSSCMWIL